MTIPFLATEDRSWITEQFLGWLADLMDAFLTQAFKWLTDYVISLTDMSGNGVDIEGFLTWSQYIGLAMIIYFTQRRLFKAIVDPNESVPDIIGSAAFSIFNLFFVPFFFKKVPLAINNKYVEAVGDKGITNMATADDFFEIYTSDGNVLSLALMPFLLMFLFALSAIVFTIVSVYRNVALYGSYVLGPILSAGYVDSKDMLQTYWTETLAIIFTQSWQITLAYWAFQWVAQGTWEQLTYAIMALFVGAAGPVVAKRYLLKTGLSQGFTGIARMMARNFKK